MRGGLRFNREDYRNVYVLYNPLTGQYGYVSENGAQGSIVPGEVGLWDPAHDGVEPDAHQQHPRTTCRRPTAT